MVGRDYIMYWRSILEQSYEGKVCILYQQRPLGWEKLHDEGTWSFREGVEIIKDYGWQVSWKILRAVNIFN